MDPTRVADSGLGFAQSKTCLDRFSPPLRVYIGESQYLMRFVHRCQVAGAGLNDSFTPCTGRFHDRGGGHGQTARYQPSVSEPKSMHI